MIKKETFVQAIKTIQKQHELTRKLNELYCQLNPGYYAMCFDGLLIDAIFSILEDAMEDIGSTISWWLYEDVEKTISWDEDGHEVSVTISTPEELYDYLVDCINERKHKQGNEGND